jgi:hypothetical protein
MSNYNSLILSVIVHTSFFQKGLISGVLSWYFLTSALLFLCRESTSENAAFSK